MSEDASGLGLAPLHDAVALAAWNQRAWAILGEERGNVLAEWAEAAQKAPQSRERQQTDSFSRRQERIRRGEAEATTGRGAAGVWEASRRGLAGIEAPEYPSNVVPLRQRIKPPEPEPGQAPFPAMGEAWGARKSVLRGAERGRATRVAAAKEQAFRPSTGTSVLRRQFTALRWSLRQVAEKAGVSRAAAGKWLDAADSIKHPVKDRLHAALFDQSNRPAPLRVVRTEQERKAEQHRRYQERLEAVTLKILCEGCSRWKRVKKPSRPSGPPRRFCDTCRDERQKAANRKSTRERHHRMKVEEPERYEARLKSLRIYDAEMRARRAEQRRLYAFRYRQRNRDAINQRKRDKREAERAQAG